MGYYVFLFVLIVISVGAFMHHEEKKRRPGDKNCADLDVALDEARRKRVH